MSMSLPDRRNPHLSDLGQQTAQTAAAISGRFQQQADQQELARASFGALCLDYAAGPGGELEQLPWKGPLFDASAEKGRLNGWLAGVDFCVTQEELEAALSRGEWAIRCHSARGLEFQAEIDRPCRLTVFGNARVDVVVRTSSEIRFYQHSHGRVESLVEARTTKVSLCQKSEAVLLGEVSAYCYGDSLACPEGEDVYVTLRARARCLLGRAAAVFANEGTAVITSETASCDLIKLYSGLELFELPREDREPALILDSDGATLLSGHELEDGEERKLDGIDVLRAVRAWDC